MKKLTLKLFSGLIFLFGDHYDDGDNNYDNDGNPYTQESFVSYKDKIYLELEESKYISSKKIRIKFLSTTPAAEITINKIYFTGEKNENKSPVIDEKSDANAVLRRK